MNKISWNKVEKYDFQPLESGYELEDDNYRITVITNGLDGKRLVRAIAKTKNSKGLDFKWYPRMIVSDDPELASVWHDQIPKRVEQLQNTKLEMEKLDQWIKSNIEI